MRFILHMLLAICVALGVGFGLSYYAVSDGRLIGATQIGPWLAWPAAGSPHPDPYSKAYVARRGALQLGLSEGIQFTADTDSDGHQLRANCSYSIDGSTPQATLWTLVAVDRNGQNIAASNEQAFLDNTHLVRPADGQIAITVSPFVAAGNWLQIKRGGPFSLRLTLYDTPALSGGPGDRAELPSISRLECQ